VHKTRKKGRVVDVVTRVIFGLGHDPKNLDGQEKKPWRLVGLAVFPAIPGPI
jgi:hypothetical protein